MTSKLRPYLIVRNLRTIDRLSVVVTRHYVPQRWDVIVSEHDTEDEAIEAYYTLIGLPVSN